MKYLVLCLSLIVFILGFSRTIDVVPHAKSFSDTASIMITGFGFVGVGTVLRRRSKPARMMTQKELVRHNDAGESPGAYPQQPDTYTMEPYQTTGFYSTLAKNDLMRGCSILSENRSSG